MVVAVRELEAFDLPPPGPLAVARTALFLDLDGTLAAIHKKWLGADADPSTSTVMVLDLPMAQ